MDQKALIDMLLKTEEQKTLDASEISEEETEEKEKGAEEEGESE